MYRIAEAVLQHPHLQKMSGDFQYCLLSTRTASPYLRLQRDINVHLAKMSNNESYIMLRERGTTAMKCVNITGIALPLLRRSQLDI